MVAFSVMNRILEINPANRCAVVEPGVVIAEFQRAVEKMDLFYPPDPGSANVATMGGAVVMNAGGMRGVKYGVTRDSVLGLEVVLPSGEVMGPSASCALCSPVSNIFLGRQHECRKRCKKAETGGEDPRVAPQTGAHAA